MKWGGTIGADDVEGSLFVACMRDVSVKDGEMDLLMRGEGLEDKL